MDYVYTSLNIIYIVSIAARVFTLLLEGLSLKVLF